MNTIQSSQEHHGRARERPGLPAKAEQEDSHGKVHLQITRDQVLPELSASKPSGGWEKSDQTASVVRQGGSQGASSKTSGMGATSGSHPYASANRGSDRDQRRREPLSKPISGAKLGQDKDERWSQGEPTGSCESPRDMRATSSDEGGDLEEELDDVKDMQGEVVQSQLTTDFAKESTASGDRAGPRLPGGWRGLENLDSLPLMKSGYSLEADMKFGWKPRIKGKVLPIPLIFDVEDEYFTLDHYLDPRDPRKGTYPTIFTGWRPADSLKMYRRLQSNTNKHHGTEFQLKIPAELPPAVQKLLDQQMQERVLGGSRSDDDVARPGGMDPEFRRQCEAGEILQFDSAFESGNLDRVVMVSPTEYDLYMRPDTNARGHHQWFYFRVTSRTNLGPVKFNILNFTKRRSLYENGMRICICSLKEKEARLASAKAGAMDSPLDAELAGWKRGGYDITYKPSKLNRIIERRLQSESPQAGAEGSAASFPRFFQMSFTYDFNLMVQDETYFAYSFPYTFTRLSRFLKELKADPEVLKHTKDCTPLCQSLSGVDVPYLVVTSRVNEPDFEEIRAAEHSPESLPLLKTKKIVVVTGRVHPGESNSSFMMEGFIKFLTSPTNPVAQELRKRIIFRIIPCTNPDGVIAGNYRVAMSGNDLNRRYQSPHPRLHPIVCAVKKLFRDLKPDLQCQEENQILAFIDMHGHSRKKNVFMYGPGYPIHDVRYLKMRVLPKLMSEQSAMFRFYSCKFRIQRSKERTARVVLWREFNIMNCYTLEASFHGFFDRERETTEFQHSHLLKVGKMLANTIFEYTLMRDDEERHLKDLRAKREEVKRNKTKAAGTGQQPSKSKEESASKVRDGSLGGGGRAVLSPSASSEAIANIDDQQPDPALANKKINHIRKKLLHAQQNKKQQQSSAGGKEAAQNASSRAGPSGQKKKFKLTKKFKDDVVPQAAPTKSANPNQPPEDGEEAEEVEDGQEGSSDEPEQAAEEAAKPDAERNAPPAATDLAFVAKFKLNRRTLADLCNQIETEEQKKEENAEEVGTSDAGATTDGGRAGADAYGSDDEANGVLLQQIQGKILGVLKLDAAVPPDSKSQKPAQSKDQKSKKAKQKASQSAATASAKANAQPAQAHSKSEKKPSSTLKSQESMTKKMLASKMKESKALLGGERRSHQTGAMLRRPEDGVPENTRERVRPRLAAPDPHKAPLAFSSATNASAPHPPQQHYPGILLQLTNNNFNDRIMTQPYHKYKKPKYPGLSGGLHQLQSLTANAHQLLQKQIQREKGPGLMRDPYKLDKNQQAKDHPNPGDVSTDGKPKYSFYNFQARNGNERSIPLVASGGGPSDQGVPPSSWTAESQGPERRSHGADPFGIEPTSHRYQPAEAKAQPTAVHDFARAGRTEVHNFPKPHSQFGASAIAGGPVQQLQSHPSLGAHHGAAQGDEVYYHLPQQCAPHLTPQLAKHQGLGGPTPQLVVEQDPTKPGQYHTSSAMQRPAHHESGPPNTILASQTQPRAAASRPGVSAGGFKTRNRRLLPVGELVAGEAAAADAAVPGETPELLAPGNQYQDSPEGPWSVPGDGAVERRQPRRPRKHATEWAEKTQSANHGLQPAQHRGLAQNVELTGPRPSVNPGPITQSSVLGSRLADSVSQSTRADLAAFGAPGASLGQPPPMWCESSQHFALGGRAQVAAIPSREPRQLRDGAHKQLVSAQPSSAHCQKEPLLSLPQSKPHSVQIEELSLPSRSSLKSKGATQAQAAGDYQLSAHPPAAMDQKRSEYVGQHDRQQRLQRQAQSHRKEALFEYPTLPAGPTPLYQTATGNASKPDALGHSISRNVSDPPRPKDAEVLRSVEQTTAMLAEAMPKSGSTVVKPGRATTKGQNKEAQRANRPSNQTAIMVRGVGAPRVTYGPFINDNPVQGAASGLQRDLHSHQFASQLSLSKDSYFQNTTYHATGFQTRVLVPTNAKPGELPNQKPLENSDTSFQIRKQQSILKPVLGATSLQRKIVQSAVNEKLQNRANLLLENQTYQRYSKRAVDAREAMFIASEEQMYQDEQHLIKSVHINDREMMQQWVQQRPQNSVNQGASPQMNLEACRPSPQRSYGGDQMVGQSFSYNARDQNAALAETMQLPKSKGGTLVQTGQSQLTNPAALSREARLRQNQNLVMFMDGDVDAASASASHERVPATNVFDILHRQDLHQQQRQPQQYGPPGTAPWEPVRRQAAPTPKRSPLNG